MHSKSPLIFAQIPIPNKEQFGQPKNICENIVNNSTKFNAQHDYEFQTRRSMSCTGLRIFETLRTKLVSIYPPKEIYRPWILKKCFNPKHLWNLKPLRESTSNRTNLWIVRHTKFSHTFEGWRLKVLFWGLTLTKRENKLTDHIFVGEGQQNWWM